MQRGVGKCVFQLLKNKTKHARSHLICGNTLCANKPLVERQCVRHRQVSSTLQQKKKTLLVRSLESSPSSAAYGFKRFSTIQTSSDSVRKEKLTQKDISLLFLLLLSSCLRDNMCQSILVFCKRYGRTPIPTGSYQAPGRHSHTKGAIRRLGLSH